MATVIYGLPLIYWLLLAGAFIAGFALLPLISLTIGTSLPIIIAEPLANLLLKVGMAPLGHAVLMQQEDDSYRFVRPPDGLEGADRKWSRFALVRFGIGFERSPAAFDRTATDIERDNYVEEQTFSESGCATADGYTRDGIPAWLDVSEASEFDVPTGEYLSQFEHAAGVDALDEAQQSAMEDHGGDSGGFSQRVMAATFIVLALSSFAISYTVFFGF